MSVHPSHVAQRRIRARVPGIKVPDNASSLQPESQVTAPSFKVRMIGEFADDAGDVCQSGPDVEVRWSINRQFVENAGNAAPLQQLSPFGAEQVDASADPVEIGLPPLVTVGQVAAQASFYGVCKDFGNQMRYVIWPMNPDVRGSIPYAIGGSRVALSLRLLCRDR